MSLPRVMLPLNVHSLPLRGGPSNQYGIAGIVARARVRNCLASLSGTLGRFMRAFRSSASVLQPTADISRNYLSAVGLGNNWVVVVAILTTFR